MTNAYESATVPGIYFGGTITQGVCGTQEVRHPGQLRRRPRPPLQRPPPRRRHRRPAARPAACPSGRRSTPSSVVDLLLDAVPRAPGAVAPEVVPGARDVARPGRRIRDEGIVSLAEFVDAAGPDGVAITVETDDRGRHPSGRLRAPARACRRATPSSSSEPLHDFRTDGHRSQLRDMIDGVLARVLTAVVARLGSGYRAHMEFRIARHGA